MDRPPPDPVRLLEQWMEWERGEETPGRVMANLKTSGLRDVLEQLAAASAAGASPNETGPDETGPGETSAAGTAPEWTPSV
jgi:hypothetical protein